MISIGLPEKFAISQSLIERETTCSDTPKIDFEIPASIMSCAKKRVNDYVAGRLAAHQAIACQTENRWNLAGESVAVTRQENGMPSWPDPFVGSITHTKQFAWAVVGFQADLLGIGVDCEQVVSRRTSLDISELVATRDELDLIQSKFDFETSLTLCFSAKEAVYKTINPITNWPIDFRDLSVITFHDSSLRIQLKPNRFDFATAIGFDVGFEFANDHVFSWSLFPHSPISVDLTRHISSRQLHSIKNTSTVASIW